MTKAGMQLDPNPILEFERWFADANARGVPMPEAMCLATISDEGFPSARMVLFKGLIDSGFSFYTNYTSRKARHLEQRPEAALVFHWKEVERQIRIEGTVNRVSPEHSDAYFASRGRGSRLAAWASRQSQPYESRGALLEQYAQIEQRFDGVDVPRPEFWGGYRLAPRRIEFWAGLPDRFHDRVEYLHHDSGWTQQRLQP